VSNGQRLYEFASSLYPICRSITGNGVRETLRLVGQHIPLQTHEVPTGSRAFDWEVPVEWNIEDAYVMDADGRRVVDFREHNLHIVSYSEPISASMSREDLLPHLHTLPERPDWIPYRTSYYRRSWGFCLRQRDLERLPAGAYHVEIKSRLERGSLTYAEAVIPGRTRDEVLFFAHVCHPSLANDNTSGIAIATALAQWVAGESRRYTYRFVFAPGTIGSLCWLARNESRLKRVRHGLVLALLGDPGQLTYKMSRSENSVIDAVAGYVLAANPGARVIGFSPYGYDERQLCSPGFNLPVGRLTRSVNGGYPQYHSSADDLSLIRPECLAQSYDVCQQIISILETDGRYVNLSPKGEPLLGRRGLYGAVGGRSPAEREHALLWVLNQSDGTRSLLDIARRSGIDFERIREAAGALEDAALLRQQSQEQGRRSTGARRSPKTRRRRSKRGAR
jgi:aminopeptidase-like protein